MMMMMIMIMKVQESARLSLFLRVSFGCLVSFESRGKLEELVADVTVVGHISFLNLPLMTGPCIVGLEVRVVSSGEVASLALVLPVCDSSFLSGLGLGCMLLVFGLRMFTISGGRGGA